MEETLLSTAEEIAELRNELEKKGEKLVLTNGVFDLLHVGHIRYLNEARQLGDALVVAINSDESVRELKGPGRPVHNEAERAEILLSLSSVDRVVVFREKRASKIIETIRPHIYTKGGDYTPDSLIDEEKELLDRLGIEIRILSLVKGKSTSTILNQTFSDKSTGRRIAILGSGKGSNCKAILDAIESGSLQAEVVLVLSDVADSGILKIAHEFGVPAIHVDPGTETRGQLTDASIKEITDRLQAARVDLVVLAGFMRILRAPLLDQFENRILNIHPSLLPKYPGLNTCKRAIEAGDAEAGCTIHMVDAGVDSGKILRQERVSILPDDTPESLQERIQMVEHRSYPQVIGEVLASL